MFPSTLRPARSWRASALLLLLVLGIVARPVVEQIGGMHAVEHAALATADAGHAHDHPDHDPAKDPEHAKGLHGLMHLSDGGTAATLSTPWGLALAIAPTGSPPIPRAATPRLGAPGTLFRPPIA